MNGDIFSFCCTKAQRLLIGYTFVAEARTTDQPIVGNKWKMRLIGSMAQLPMPAPARTEVQSSFHTREIRDYYLPQDNNVMLR